MAKNNGAFQDARISALKRDGLSVAEIAAQLGYGVRSVRTVVRRAGFPPEPRRKAKTERCFCGQPVFRFAGNRWCSTTCEKHWRERRKTANAKHYLSRDRILGLVAEAPATIQELHVLLRRVAKDRIHNHLQGLRRRGLIVPLGVQPGGATIWATPNYERILTAAPLDKLAKVCSTGNSR